MGNIIGLGMEVFAYRQIAMQTNGCYVVAPNTKASTIAVLIQYFISPPILTLNAKPCLLHVGVPSISPNLPRLQKTSGYCSFILKQNYPPTDEREKHMPVKKYDYLCPRCKGYVSILPDNCSKCGLLILTKLHTVKAHTFFKPLLRYSYMRIKNIKQN